MTDDGDDGCDVDGGECWSHIHRLFFSPERFAPGLAPW